MSTKNDVGDGRTTIKRRAMVMRKNVKNEMDQEDKENDDYDDYNKDDDEDDGEGTTVRGRR